MREAPSAVVVVAEDDDELRALLCDAVAARGWRVVELEDVAELDDYVAFIVRHGAPQGLPDAVLTDVRMPGGSGLDVIARARSAGVHCPFVVLTAFPGPDIEARVRTLGSTWLVGKPAPLKLVCDTVALALAKREAPVRAEA
jgi:DNA-binding response OmpR family regulator